MSRVKGRLDELRRPLRVRDFRLLWSAQVVSEVGDWSARIALAALVFERTGSAAWTGAITAASLAPWIGLAPFLAAAAERFPRKRVLLTCDIGRALLFTLILAPVPLGVTFVAAVAAAMLAPPFTSARSALLPDIVPENDFGAALSVAHMTTQVAQLTGFFIGGGLIGLLGAQGALAVNAASFAVSALFVAGLAGGRVAHGAAHGVLGRLRRATKFLWAERVVRRAVLVAAVAQLGAAVVEALVVVDVERHLDAPDMAIGVLSAALPIGFLITMAVIRTDNGEAAALRQSARLILIGSVIAIAGFAAQMPWPAAVVPYLGVGIMVTSLVPANAVGTPRIPTDIRGSAIGVLQSTIIGSQALGAMLGGLVAAVWSVTAALTVAMVPCVLVAGYALLRPIATEPGPARQEMGEVARTPGQDTRPAPSS